MKEMPKDGGLFSNPSAGSAGVELALFGLLDASRRWSAIAATDNMYEAVWDPLLLPLFAAPPEKFQPSILLPNCSQQNDEAKVVS